MDAPTPIPPAERPPEPPPPTGSWKRFYLVVALVHILVVAALVALSLAFRPGSR